MSEHPPMRFYTDAGLLRTHGGFYLRHVGWDDWYKFETTFDLIHFSKDGERVEVGRLKIGQKGMQGASNSERERLADRRPPLRPWFDELEDDYFSLGQEAEYYSRLRNVCESEQEAVHVLRGLRDVAFDTDRFERFFDEPVMRISLLREVTAQSVRGQFGRVARGGAIAEKWTLAYPFETRDGVSIPLEFIVDPDTPIASNVHAVIGRNGVGKSTFLHRIVDSYSPVEPLGSPVAGRASAIANVILVSFSAFDRFTPTEVPEARSAGPTIHYVGLKDAAVPDRLKGETALDADLKDALELAMSGARRERLRTALALLETDPLFADEALSRTVPSGEEGAEAAIATILQVNGSLSSGHRLVLLTTATLVALVEERSLVLIDEPEAHLHPPLLSSYIRSLSELLSGRNGVALLATHSPVVLQDIPRECVWVLERRGNAKAAARPSIETFGENVGTLTNHIFGLEVASTGYHRQLRQLYAQYRSADAVVTRLRGLGLEGRIALAAIDERPTTDVAG